MALETSLTSEIHYDYKAVQNMFFYDRKEIQKLTRCINYLLCMSPGNIQEKIRLTQAIDLGVLELEDIHLPAEQLSICVVNAFHLLFTTESNDFKHLFKKPAGKVVSLIKGSFLFRGKLDCVFKCNPYWQVALFSLETNILLQPKR